MDFAKSVSPKSGDPFACSRRGFLKQSSLVVAGAALGSKVAATQEAAPPQRPAAPLGGSSDSELFWIVETTSGKVQGIANTGIKEF
jgi:hypothetical protein